MDVHPTTTKLIRRALACALIAGSTAAGEDEPLPKPTPRAGTLAAFASTTTLDRSALGGGTGTIVITGDNLAELGRGAVVTQVEHPIAPPPVVRDIATPTAKTRERWRKKVLAKSRSIAKLETGKQAIEAEIDRLARGRLDSRTLDRIERAEARLEQAEAEIRRENVELAKIVRDARKEGAQPGWFR
jgi:hypothetical protein